MMVSVVNGRKSFSYKLAAENIIQTHIIYSVTQREYCNIDSLL